MDRLQTVFALAVLGLVVGLRPNSPVPVTVAAEPLAAAAAPQKQRGSAVQAIAEVVGATPDETKDARLEARARAAFQTANVLVATLPHPKASFLDWAFDSHLDAIRRGFERAGLTLVRHSLPWTDDWKKSAETPDLGVLVFRGKDEKDATKSAVHVVLLVPETSTGGIDRTAFRAALEERAAVLELVAGPAGADAQVEILGPVFSGSSSSLRDALESAATHDRTQGSSAALLGEQSVRIVSGAATSEANTARLERGARAPEVEFETTLHTDDVLLHVLSERLLPRLGLEVDQIALLQESTTEYGREVSKSVEADALQAPATGGASKPKAFLRIPFPMSIATLRGASRKDELDATVASSPTNVGRARSRVSLSMSETADRMESIPPSSELTPASIDLLLEELGRSLAMRGIRGVLLFATDVRDKLYLAKELKKRLPDLQIFTTESNVLYVRPEFNTWMRGAIVLSTYPLLLRDPTWRAQARDGQELVFANEGAVGTYNATLELLGKADAMADYRYPFESAVEDADHERPPVWATVVGAGSMLPLAVFGEAALRAGVTATSSTGVVHAVAKSSLALAPNTPLPRAREGSTSSTSTSESGRHFTAVAGTSLLAVLAVVVVIVDRRRRPLASDRDLPPLADTSFAEHATWAARHCALQGASLALHAEIYSALLYVSLLGMLVPSVTLALCGGGWSVSDLLPARVLGLVALAVVASALLERLWRIVASLRRNGRRGIQHMRERDWPKSSLRTLWRLEIGLRASVFALGLCYFALTVVFAAQIADAHAQGRATAPFALFFRRAIEVDQGASPLVPLMLIGLIFSTWSAWHLRRIHMLAHPMPAHRLLDRGAEAQRAAHGRTAAIWAKLFLASPDAAGSIPLGCIVIAVVWTWVQFSPTLEALVFDPHVLGMVSFDVLLRLGILGALAASCWAVYRLIVVWLAFRDALRDQGALLSALPFTAVREAHGFNVNSSLWPSSDVTEMRRVARAHWDEFAAAHKTGDALAPPTAGTSDVPGEGNGGSTLAQDLHSSALPGTVPARRDPPKPGDLDAVERLAASLDELRAEAAASTSDSAPSRRARLASEILCVEVMLFVEWMISHVRHLCFFLLASIVLTTLLIASYPYHPRELVQLISWLVFAGVIGVLVWLIAALNRDPVLSRMSGTDEGRITWDRALFVNVALYVIVPVITLLGSSSPGLRDSFLSWVKPLLQGASGA